MQPPLILRPLREQIEHLREQARLSAQQKPTDKNMDSKIVDEYTTRIRNWQEHSAPIQRQRLFTIDELIRLTNLNGRFRINASHRYTGEALRRCGFKQKRDWTVSGRNKRYWIWSSR
jgi:hypothetical protein